MKRAILSLAMALMVSVAFGQTVDRLFDKWKATEGAEYEETTEENRTELEKNMRKSSTGYRQKDIDFTMKHFKKAGQVQLTLDNDQIQELDADIQALKDYKTLFVYNDNKASNDSVNPIRQMFDSMLNPHYQITVYGCEHGNTVDGLLVRWDVWNKVVLGHLDCKFKKDVLRKALVDNSLVQVNFEGDDTEDGGMIDMSKVMEDVKNGNVLFVINGVEHPYFHSTEEARNYMITNGIKWNSETWVIGEEVKEKYPHTDRKVAIEYSETKKAEIK